MRTEFRWSVSCTTISGFLQNSQLLTLASIACSRLGKFGVWIGCPLRFDGRVYVGSAGTNLFAAQLMNITLTYDHRLVDGAYGGSFLRDLRVRLEGWETAE